VREEECANVRVVDALSHCGQHAGHAQLVFADLEHDVYVEEHDERLLERAALFAAHHTHKLRLLLAKQRAQTEEAKPDPDQVERGRAVTAVQALRLDESDHDVQQ